MTDERDPKLSQRYRELEALEPSPELDRKILAAARAAESPHAPLVVPAGRHRWYYGLAAAAVLVFAVALTLHIERERPDPEAAAPAPQLRLERELRGQIKPAPSPEEKPSAPAREQAPQFAPDPQASAPRESRTAAAAPRPRADEQREEQAAANKAQADADILARREAAGAQRLAPAPAAAQVAAAPENPERWLERIVELRGRGRHAEADRELAAFRRAYPDYRLSDLMRERVEGTPTPSR
jgi:hypothetical protein